MPRSREIQDLLDQFVGLEGASQVYGMLSNHNNRPKLQEALRKVNHPFSAIVAGKVFELFGYDYQKRNLPPGNRLLTPRATLHFFSQVTNREIHPTLDGYGKAIHQIITPDGLEFSESNRKRKIEKLHEYKLSQDSASIRKQMDKFLGDSLFTTSLRLMNTEGQSRAGNILAALILGKNSPLVTSLNLRIRYTVPQNSVLRNFNLPDRVSIDYLPIHTMILRELTNAIMEEGIAKNLKVPPSSRVLS